MEFEEGIEETPMQEKPIRTTGWSDSVKMLNQHGFLRVLKDMALQGELNRSNLRSVCWKLFLSILSEDKSVWVAESEKCRRIYADLKKKHITDPHNEEQSMDVALNNPLSQDEDSPWNKYFKDNELKKLINQDVVRTFPEVEFFKDKDVRDMMMSILFCHAKEHPDINYRQGMHELLAPVLFVMATEQREDIESDPTLSPELKVVMDPKYTEHDSFTIFSEIMEHVSPWYVNEESQQAFHNAAKMAAANKWSDPRSATPFQRENMFSSALSKKVEKIQFVLLKNADNELFERLNELDILPQVYGIRWIRLLFGREFPLPSVLELWDAIFADSSAMSLVEYLCVAMLVLIRKQLMLCDNPSAMQLLMQYPWISGGYASTWDVNDLVQLAVHFRKPDLTSLPNRAKQLFLFSDVYHDPLMATAMASHHAPRPAMQYQPHGSPVVAKNSRFRIKAPKIGSILARPGGVARQPYPPPSQHPPGTPPMHNTSHSHQQQQQHHPSQRHQRHNAPPDSTSRTQKKGNHPRIPGRPESVLRSQLSGQELTVNPTQPVVDGTSKERVEMLETMCKYCGDKMESYLNVLQEELTELELPEGPMEKIFIKLAELKQLKDLLQGKLPFAGSDWAPSDATDEGKQIDSSQEQQYQTSSDTLTQDEPLTREDTDSTTDATDATDAANDKSAATKSVESSSVLSDEDEAIFGTDPLSNTKREELLKAVFDNDNSTTDGHVQDTNAVTNSHYDPDDWVDIPNDELI